MDYRVVKCSRTGKQGTDLWYEVEFLKKRLFLSSRWQAAYEMTWWPHGKGRRIVMRFASLIDAKLYAKRVAAEGGENRTKREVV